MSRSSTDSISHARVARVLAILLGSFAVSDAHASPMHAGSASRTPGTIHAQELPDERQILWQRSLEDAVAISGAEQRPILVAVNMDGESASERIVRENYRDPEFVALTRRFVCVAASAFRHAPRDHDDRGRRISCPRLGEITCGEHIALEPILFDRYLGGERIAPRHALILPDGTKSFDLFLLFDLGDLDRKLAETQDLAPLAEAVTRSAADRAGARDHRGRLAFETDLLRASTQPEVLAAIDVLSKTGDAGSIEALRILLQSTPPPSEDGLSRIASMAESLGIVAPAAVTVRERLTGLGRWPGAPGLGQDQELLLLLGSLDARSAATRSLLFGYGVLGMDSERSLSLRALRSGLTVDEEREVSRSLERVGGQASIGSWLSNLRETAPTARSTPKTAEVLPESDALEAELARLDEEIDRRPDDSELVAAYGKTTLALARRRMEGGGSGAELLLQDADHYLEQASRSKPEDVSILLARARTAYLLGRFEAQESIARQAIAVARDDDRFEALRWLGDAAARLLTVRSGGPPAVEVEGLLCGARALQDVAAGPEADETDWISLASFLGALGMRREELAVLQAGAERMPASTALRTALNSSLWAGGRIDLAVPKSEWIARAHPESADAAWHAGYARILVAEELRRAEQPESAIEAYARADRWFEWSAAMKPEYSDTSGHYRALSALGCGFAHILAGRRVEAAESLADGLAIRPAIASVRDGLDREAVDLLDAALEWRAEGASRVDPLKFLADLSQADPGNAFWPRAISDSQLRETLRADGRGEGVEGDRYLHASIEAGRRALAITDDPEIRRALAQPLTVCGERLLERQDPEGARRFLAEAAEHLGEVVPAEGAGAQAIEELAARLREKLGAARPRFRPGR